MERLEDTLSSASPLVVALDQSLDSLGLEWAGIRSGH